MAASVQNCSPQCNKEAGPCLAAGPVIGARSLLDIPLITGDKLVFDDDGKKFIISAQHSYRCGGR